MLFSRTSSRLWLAAAMLAGLSAPRPGLAAPQPDERPAFDKTPYLKTVWTQANPWFLPTKPASGGLGGPDFAWHEYLDDPVLMWKQVAERCQPFGLTGLQMEMQTFNGGGYHQVYLNMLEGFRLAGNSFMGQIFFATHPKDPQQTIEGFLATLEKIAPQLRDHPNVYRLGGAPVVCIYDPKNLGPTQWKQVIDAVEARHGRFIWLMNVASGVHADAEMLRRYMPVFDGLTMYANWTLDQQRRLFAELMPVMREEFPQKIFEVSAHTHYTVHFWYGGMDPQLSEKFRGSWELTLAAEPDAISITNFFDIYENSRILPSYELDDLRLRLSQHFIEGWRNGRAAPTRVPDLYATNPISVLLGQPLRFEVLGFPLEGAEQQVEVTLEVCASDGGVLHAFAPRTMVLDALRVETFELGTEELVDQRAVHPRVRYRWQGRPTFDTGLLPPTHLATSIRPHLLHWARSFEKLIRVKVAAPWSIEGQGPGQTAVYPPAGRGVVQSSAVSPGRPGADPAYGGGRVRLLRNGRELARFDRWGLDFTRAFALPDPGGALDWYNLELVNPHGGRYLSPPIWVGGDQRPGQVTLPIWLASGEIAAVSVEAARVPFFHYGCDRDTGRLLLDRSGYDHHGYLGGRYIEHTGYRHEHGGPVPIQTSDACPTFERDAQGRGYLRFDGQDDYAQIHGGTAFPYASTYELLVRPTRRGVREGVLGAGNGQIRILHDADGTVLVERSSAQEGEGGAKEARRFVAQVRSRQPIPLNEWTHVAATYDLERLGLYINGELQGEAEAPPQRSHEWINAVVVGALCRFPFYAETFFAGDVRQLRIYGRNLGPAEFLRD